MTTNELRSLYPWVNKQELQSLIGLVSLMSQLSQRAQASREITARILRAIRLEWHEEQERRHIRVSWSYMDALSAFYRELAGFRRMLLPVGIATLLLLYSYAPDISVKFKQISGTTIDSFSGSLSGDIQWTVGLAGALGAILVIVMVQRSRK